MTPETPPGLSGKGADLWAAVTRQWELDPDRLAALEVACRSLCRLTAAEAVVEQEGLLSTGSTGQPVAHPLCAVIDRERTGFLRAMRSLRLDEEVV